MEFRLIYEGPLHGQGARSSHKLEIRRALHPQLEPVLSHVNMAL
jgi:hypothetical protein